MRPYLVPGVLSWPYLDIFFKKITESYFAPLILFQNMAYKMLQINIALLLPDLWAWTQDKGYIFLLAAFVW
jgi:hypothetical protein